MECSWDKTVLHLDDWTCYIFLQYKYKHSISIVGRGTSPCACIRVFVPNLFLAQAVFFIMLGLFCLHEATKGCNLQTLMQRTRQVEISFFVFVVFLYCTYCGRWGGVVDKD